MQIGLILVFAAEIVATVVEPVPADPWKERFTANCGENSLEIVRPIYPSTSAPTVRFNGEELQNAARLIEELGKRGAAYRMSFVCSRTGGGLTFRWVSGLSDDQGVVTFRAGSASFSDGDIHDLMVEEVNEEAFWYR